VLLAAALLVGATVAVFGQVAGFSFITSDDGPYVTQNPTVRAGLTGFGLRWAFGFQESNWHPLTWLSLMLDAEIGGGAPGVFHVTNLILHTANTLLLFWMLLEMTGALWRSCFAALLFAVHPQHVESVAWVVERKDVLSTFFWLLALLAYARRARRPGSPSRSLLVLLAFACGLASKPMLVTLPLTLLLLDFWPLERKGWVRLVLEKLPLFALSGIAALLTLAAQSRGGALSDLGAFPLAVRLGNAAISYVAYVVKTLWPSQLAYFYPHPGRSLSVGAALACGGLLLAASAAAWGVRRRFPYVTFGWLWYVITLVPVAGVVQVGLQARADRYTYVPLIGLFVAAAWGAAELAGRSAGAAATLRLKLVVSACAASAIALAIAAHLQTRHWRDSVTLYEHALEVTSNNAVAHANLALALLERDDLVGAIAHGREALRISPGNPEAPNHVATALSRQGNYDEAVAIYRAALALRPRDATLHSNLGAVLGEQGRLEEAERNVREALRLAPSSADAHNNLGVLLAGQGRYDAAVDEFTAALQLSPFDDEVRANLERARALNARRP
jgi:Flp pilus assembly protein TadD